ncbi:ATP-binding protein [Nakamurella flava]|uniref:ATP-binding protein n=1 Tax=Nakamurella flava TaxID=2576308 RepID=A0A4V6CR63_9ACTN|nr:ATP-binding protein [Nakamurella flava]TKV56155.1 ATP-binding protein [Nakamurella flava]
MTVNGDIQGRVRDRIQQRDGSAGSDGRPGGSIGRATAERLAVSLADLYDIATVSVRPRSQPFALRRISEHLGVESYLDATIVSAHWPHWRHLSMYRAVRAYLDEHTPGARWFGLPNVPYREQPDLMNLLRNEAEGRIEEPANADYASLANGPESTEEAVSFGMVATVGPTGAPVVITLRTAYVSHPPPMGIDVLAADRADARAMIELLEETVDAHEAVRGQVVSFSESETNGNELVSFLRRPDVPASDVILPPEVLPAIERHVLGPAQYAARLRAAGIHLKRGLLLHGPPGTGKTHIVRYLMGRLRESTVIVLTGVGLKNIDYTAALARRLAPTLIVVEDVDLIAADRSTTPHGNPLLFSLLDAMDGVAADADVTFVLTTNRADILEEALIQRPGRIDLAVEVPRPDAAGRLALARLYSGTAEVTADLTPLVAVTEGATASAIKEVMRRAVLAAFTADPDADEAAPLITDAVLRGVLDEFTRQREALSRAVLGGPVDPDAASGPDGQADDSGRPAGWQWDTCAPPDQV